MYPNKIKTCHAESNGKIQFRQRIFDLKDIFQKLQIFEDDIQGELGLGEPLKWRPHSDMEQ